MLGHHPVTNKQLPQGMERLGGPLGRRARAEPETTARTSPDGEERSATAARLGTFPARALPEQPCQDRERHARRTLSAGANKSLGRAAMACMRLSLLGRGLAQQRNGGTVELAAEVLVQGLGELRCCRLGQTEQGHARMELHVVGTAQNVRDAYPGVRVDRRRAFP